jgi:hypothetical protein
MGIAVVVTTVIAWISDPVNVLVLLVRVVPIGIVVGDWRICPVSIHVMNPPAIAELIAGYITSIGRLGAGNRRHHRSYARNSEKRTQSKRSVKPSHASPFLWADRPSYISVPFKRGM